MQIYVSDLRIYHVVCILLIYVAGIIFFCKHDRFQVVDELWLVRLMSFA